MTLLAPTHLSTHADDGEAAVAAAVAAGGTAGGAQARLWYGSHSLLAEWVHVLEAAGSPAAAWQ